MMRTLIRLAFDRSGASAAEMALALPLLLILLFAPFELGYYFLSEHVVQKSVRDAARYASRLPMSSYPGCTPTAAAEEQIRRVAKAGDPDGDVDNDGDQDQRLHGWTADNMTTVTVTCDTNVANPWVNNGIYVDFPMGAPVVTVTAQVPYPTLLGAVGLGTTLLTLNASSQSAVFGA
jgi:Flp pilus assembly protein TadG